MHSAILHKCKTTLCLKKPDTCDIFKYLQQIWSNINNLWYTQSTTNLQSSRTKLTCEIYFIKQGTSLVCFSGYHL